MQCPPDKWIKLKGESGGTTINIFTAGVFILGFWVIGTRIGLLFTENPMFSMFIGMIFAMIGTGLGVPVGIRLAYAYMEYRTYGHLVKD